MKAQWPWQRELQYYHKINIPDGTTTTKLIQQYHKDGRTMSIPGTSIPAIMLPTNAFLRELTHVKNLKVESFLKAEQVVNCSRSKY